MNVFIVDMEPEIAARALCDTHLNSQLKEAAQILCTVATLRKVPAAGLYLPTHAGHPCVRTAAVDLRYARWIRDHARALAAERLYRGATAEHVSLAVVERAFDRIEAAGGWLTRRDPWPQAMPAELRVPDLVSAYRAYYARDKIVSPEGWSPRRPLGRWTHREPPAWLTRGVRVEVGERSGRAVIEVRPA